MAERQFIPIAATFLSAKRKLPMILPTLNLSGATARTAG